MSALHGIRLKNTACPILYSNSYAIASYNMHRNQTCSIRQQYMPMICVEKRLYQADCYLYPNQQSY